MPNDLATGGWEPRGGDTPGGGWGRALATEEFPIICETKPKLPPKLPPRSRTAPGVPYPAPCVLFPLFYRPLPHFPSRLWGVQGPGADGCGWGVPGERSPHPPDPSSSQETPEAARGHTGRRSPMLGCGRTGAPCGYRGWAGHSPYPPEMLVPHGMQLASQILPQFPQRAGATPRSCPGLTLVSGGRRGTG